VQNGISQNEEHGDGRVLGLLKNLSKHFLLELVAAIVCDVNSERDERGLLYAQKAIIHTGLACNVNREWHIGQLASELQQIIKLYPTHSVGASIPILV